MTEIEYVLENFNRHFSSMKEKRILLHGSRNYAEAILHTFGDEYNFVGVMSMDPLDGDSWNGLRIYTEEDLRNNNVDMVILTERVKYEEAAFRTIRRICKDNYIEIYNMYGLDEFSVHYQAGTAEPLTLGNSLSGCYPYDIVCFEVMDTIFPSFTGPAGLVPNVLFTQLIPELRQRGKILRFSLRKSYPEDLQVQALKDYGFIESETELIRRTGEDLSFRTLTESFPGKKIVYFASGLVNEFILPRCYGIHTIRFVERNVLDFNSLLPSRVIPEKIPFSPDQKDRIKEQIRTHSVISFDIFDTLLVRKTLYPRDVYILTENKAKHAGYRADRLAAVRARTEDNTPFCTLDDIYEMMADFYNWNPDIEKAMKQLEVDVERSVLEPRKAVVELFNYALAQGKRVILTSDMYLPAPVLQEILQEKGISGYEKIFVSCDCKQAKQTGLYSQLLGLCDKPGDILHIGDNPEADGKAPKEYGIDSILIPSVLSLAQNSPWVKTFEFASTLAERCLLGLSVSRIFADPFQNPNRWELSLADRMAYMGNSVIGPLIAGHMCWLIQKLMIRNYDGVLFLARDGWLSCKLYERIRDRYSLPPAFYYNANRHSSFLCCSDENLQADRMTEIGRSFGLDTDQLLEKVYLVPADQLLPHDQRELNVEYIERHMPIIHKNAENARQGYLRYSEKLGLRQGGDYAVVDFIAVGNTQKCLSQILPYSFYGFYFGTYSSETLKETMIEYYLLGQNPELLQGYVELENYFSSPDPSLNHMLEDGTPVFQEELRSQEELQSLGIAWDTASSFLQEFFDLFYSREDGIAPRLVEEMYSAQTYLGIELPVYDDWFKTMIKKQD